MTSEPIQAAAGLLLAARRDRRQLTTLPAACRPRTRDQAYAIQDAVADQSGGVAGWKTGAPNSVVEPIAAPLFATLVHASPATIPASTLHMIGIEAEVAFRLGQDLSPRDAACGREAVRDAVASLHPAIEVVDSRIRDRQSAGELWRLADNQTNGALVYGDGLSNWREIDLTTLSVRLEIDGAVALDAVGGNPAGDPLRLLTWLADHCARRGRPLRAGDIVTTGSYTGMRFVQPGAAVLATFAGLGDVAVDFPR